MLEKPLATALENAARREEAEMRGLNIYSN
jgi:hypothetical protein